MTDCHVGFKSSYWADHGDYSGAGREARKKNYCLWEIFLASLPAPSVHIKPLTEKYVTVNSLPLC